jgi:hypothetical protein
MLLQGIGRVKQNIRKYDQIAKLAGCNLAFNNYRWFSRTVYSLGGLPRRHFQQLSKCPKIKSFGRAGYRTGGLSVPQDLPLLLNHRFLCSFLSSLDSSWVATS